MKRSGALLLTLVVVSLLALVAARAAKPALAADQACQASARIDIAGDLTVIAVYNVTSAPTELVVPARPPVGYFAVENGSVSLPVDFNGTDLLVAVDSPGTVNVTYVSLQATSKEGALWEANFTMPCEGPVYLPSGSTPIYVSPLPLQAYTYNGSPVLVMPAGPLTIDYMVSPPTTSVPPVTTSTTPTSTSPTSPTTSVPPVTTSTTTTSTTSPTATTTPRPSSALTYVIVGVVITVVIVAALVLLMRRRGGQAGPPTELDDRDRAILSAIAKLGGEATASQLLSETNIPKTPLYRRLDKLVRMGLLEEGSKGGVKVYRCKRPGCR